MSLKSIILCASVSAVLISCTQKEEGKMGELPTVQDSFLSMLGADKTMQEITFDQAASYADANGRVYEPTNDRSMRDCPQASDNPATLAFYNFYGELSAESQTIFKVAVDGTGSIVCLQEIVARKPPKLG